MTPTMAKRFFWIVTVLLGITLGTWLSILVIFSLSPEIKDVPLFGNLWSSVADFSKINTVVFAFLWVFLLICRFYFDFKKKKIKSFSHPVQPIQEFVISEDDIDWED